MAASQDLLDLFRAQLPDVERQHAAGNLEPLGAMLREDGSLVLNGRIGNAPEGQPVDEVISELAGAYAHLLHDRAVRAAGVFFHAQIVDDGMIATTVADAGTAIVAMLEHVSGKAVQFVVRYSRSDDRRLAPDGWLYEYPPQVSQAEPLSALEDQGDA
jgi:hypothetical protein